MAERGTVPTCKLFDEPFDLDRIERAIGEDWDRFSGLAHFFVGMRHNWEAAVVQFRDLLIAWRESGRDEKRLHPLMTLLFARTAQFGDAAVAEMRFASLLGLWLAPIKRESPPDAPVDPREAASRAWLAEYHKQRGRR